MTRLIRALLALTLAVPGVALAQQRPTLELSLEEAVKRALENNLDIKVEKYGPLASAESVRQIQGFYDPLATATLSDGSRKSPSTSQISGGVTVTTDTKVWNMGVSELLKSGGSLTLTFNNNKQDTTNVLSTFNPSFGSTMTASLSQPLLRNFKIDSSRQQLTLAKRNREVSDLVFRQIVTNTLATVKQQYNNLLAAIDNLEANRKSLALAQKLLEENQIKVRVGTLAPLDVVEAQSEVASREAGVISAESAVIDAEDALKRAIFPQSDSVMWSTRIVPTDRPVAGPYPVDAEAAIKRAIENRTDITVARKSLENSDTTLQLARNQTLPQFDFTATYGITGIGGTSLNRGGVLGGPIISTVPGGYGDALGQVFGFDFPTWTIGFNLSYPILNRSAKANSARAQLAVEQARTSLTRLEMQIASEVRAAARAVETNMKLVDSTRAARVLQAQRLDAEQKKFAAGMSTNFLVTQAQRDLAVAEVAEVQAIGNYRNSIVNFERTQEAGLGGGSGSITVSVGR